MKTIAICLTTFMRDKLLFESVKSILDNWSDNYVLLIGDQNPTKTKKQYYNNLRSEIKYYPLPFDSGLSFSRNFLVQKAKEQNIDYCIITADSIMFTKKYNLQPVIDFLENNNEAGIVGFNLLKRVPWEVDMKFIKGKGWELDIPRRKIVKFKSLFLQPCDMIKNFFIAKTKCLLENKWDEELKLSEHESFFNELKQTNWKVFYISNIKAMYKDYKSVKYQHYRRRMYHFFRNILRKKYEINGWVTYTPELCKVFSNWKKEK